MTNKYVTSQDLQDSMNLAQARAHHYQQIGWTMFTREELVSAAYEGISEALIRFEPSKGTVKDTKFTSYAYFWIEKYLKEYITKNKTMLSGSSFELWTGQVPYASSIDALDDRSNDQMGSDHKDWLGTNILPSTALEAIERQDILHELYARIFAKLDGLDRLCLQLSLGVGTVANEPMELRQIAKSTRLSIAQVQFHLDNAYSYVAEHSEELKYEFEDVIVAG